FSRTITTRLGTSWTANAICPPGPNAGASFRLPSCVNRLATGRRPALEEAIDHLPSFEDVESRAVGGGDAGQFQHRGADHRGGAGLGGGAFAARAALPDHPPGLDSPAGPDREVARVPVVARADAVDARRPAELAHAYHQGRLQQPALLQVVE